MKIGDKVTPIAHHVLNLNVWDRGTIVDIGKWEGDNRWRISVLFDGEENPDPTGFTRENLEYADA